MNNEWIAGILGCIIGIIFGVLLGYNLKDNEIEKHCMYDNRLMFGKQMYGCTWMKGVSVTETLERKPHPLAKELK